MTGSNQPALILASASPARAKVLRNAGVAFAACAAGVDEAALRHSLQSEGASAAEAAIALAELKARRGSQSAPGAYVIGADQMLECQGAWYAKPANANEARLQLQRLRGRTHELTSALALVHDGAVIWRHSEAARLSMRDFSDDFLDRYLADHGELALASVGCYQIEGPGIQLFNRVDGDFFAILGMPLLQLLDFLREHELIAK